jgi:HTH-type transcriptional regulator/antitoxin HigA
MNKLIKTSKEHETALERLEELMLGNPVPDSEDANELELLALLIKAYEDKNIVIVPPTPIEAIRFRMEQAGLTQKDLVPFIGTKSRVSEVLAGKRPLTLAMARKLHKGLGIPAEILLEGAFSCTATKAYPWLKISAKYPTEGVSYEMEDIRESIAHGRSDTAPS